MRKEGVKIMDHRIQTDQSEREAQIMRIRRYEAMMVEAQALLREEVRNLHTQELIDALEAYYTSVLWRQDYADDEAGLLPEDLKRGVLSEDGLYDLLDAWHELTKTGEVV